jgi:hypothetical protein
MPFEYEKDIMGQTGGVYMELSLDGDWYNRSSWWTNSILEVPVLNLYTGGKAVPHRESLFRITASARGRSGPIASQDIQIGQLGRLGNDGNLYKALADGTPYIVTPTVTGVKYYTFQITPQKHRLLLQANGVTLDPQRVAATAEFCVGQLVSLEASWIPELPEGTVHHFLWTISLDYANKILPGTGDASDLYLLDGDKLKANPTSLWWYNGGEKRLWCDASPVFSNGQSVTLSESGSVSLYRPRITDFKYGPPDYTTPSINNALDQGTLYLQVGDGNGHGDMQFRTEILSKYSGKADYTQLVKRVASNGSDSHTTCGVYYLDSYRFYNVLSNDPESPRAVAANQPVRHLVIADSPGFQDHWVPWWYTTAVNDHFETYIMFRPDNGNPASNIYVSLGKLTWSWNGSTTYTVGTGWSQPIGTVVGPDPGPDDSFFEPPTWIHTYPNTH